MSDFPIGTRNSRIGHVMKSAYAAASVRDAVIGYFLHFETLQTNFNEIGYYEITRDLVNECHIYDLCPIIIKS